MSILPTNFSHQARNAWHAATYPFQNPNTLKAVKEIVKQTGFDAALEKATPAEPARNS